MKIEHEGIKFALERQQGPFRLFVGPKITREFYSFLLIKNEAVEYHVPCGHRAVVHAKFLRWAKGELKRFTFRQLRIRPEKEERSLSAYADMSLDDVLRVLNGEVSFCDLTKRPPTS